MGHWGLAQLAECLLPLLGDDEEAQVQSARDALDVYAPRLEERYHGGLRRKIGLATEAEGDIDLITDLLQKMAEQRADFTLTFRRLSELTGEPSAADDAVRELFADPAPFDQWAVRWRERLAAETASDAERREAMRAVNPAYIPRNHRIQQVIDAAAQEDLGPLEDMLQVLASPYEDHPELAAYAQPPAAGEEIRQTFCGT
jgi:uncharacterized protein YdiU (UPF0061 family)